MARITHDTVSTFQWIPKFLFQVKFGDKLGGGSDRFMSLLRSRGYTDWVPSEVIDVPISSVTWKSMGIPMIELPEAPATRSIRLSLIDDSQYTFDEAFNYWMNIEMCGGTTQNIGLLGEVARPIYIEKLGFDRTVLKRSQYLVVPEGSLTGQHSSKDPQPYVLSINLKVVGQDFGR